MNKNILFICTFILVSFTANAQIKKKTISKAKPPQNKYIKPKQIIQERTKHITEDEVSHIVVMDAYPMVSDETQKYEDEKICKQCDTLILEAGAPHILLFNITSMNDFNYPNRYSDQPAMGDKRYTNFEFSELAKREWEELHKNYKKSEINYHHLYRNTYVKIENATQEIVNLLNRQDNHEGLIYWSGNANDIILHSNKLYLNTEKIADVREENKKSSYYQTFLKDSINIENLCKTTQVNEELKQQMNVILLKEIESDLNIPFPFMDLKKVYRIKLKLKEDLILTFNDKERLKECEFGEKEKHTIIYQNNLPTTITEKGKVNTNFFYQDNKVTVKENSMLKVYQLEGKVLLRTLQYFIGKSNYEKIDLDCPVKWNIKTENGATCEYMTRTDGNETLKNCYSNNQWKLPLTIDHGESSETTYTMNENGELVIEFTNTYRSVKQIYEMENGIIKHFKYFKKKENEDFKELISTPVEYEYYK